MRAVKGALFGALLGLIVWAVCGLLGGAMYLAIIVVKTFGVPAVAHGSIMIMSIIYGIFRYDR